MCSRLALSTRGCGSARRGTTDEQRWHGLPVRQLPERAGIPACQSNRQARCLSSPQQDGCAPGRSAFQQSQISSRRLVQSLQASRYVLFLRPAAVGAQRSAVTPRRRSAALPLPAQEPRCRSRHWSSRRALASRRNRTAQRSVPTR